MFPHKASDRVPLRTPMKTLIKRSHAIVLFEEDDPLNTVCSGKKRGHMLLSKSKKFSVCDGTGWHSLTSGNFLVGFNSAN